jgi:hypothetical protein
VAVFARRVRLPIGFQGRKSYDKTREEVNRMDIYEVAAWAGIGSFVLALVGFVLVVWRGKRRDKKRRPPE